MTSHPQPIFFNALAPNGENNAILSNHRRESSFGSFPSLLPYLLPHQEALAARTVRTRALMTVSLFCCRLRRSRHRCSSSLRRRRPLLLPLRVVVWNQANCLADDEDGIRDEGGRVRAWKFGIAQNHPIPAPLCIHPCRLFVAPLPPQALKSKQSDIVI